MKKFLCYIKMGDKSERKDGWEEKPGAKAGVGECEGEVVRSSRTTSACRAQQKKAEPCRCEGRGEEDKIHPRALFVVTMSITSRGM